MTTRRLYQAIGATFLAAVAIVGTVAFLGGGQASASSNVLYVAVGGNCGAAAPCYGTIQAAVDAASDGDTIKVAAGTYTSLLSEVVRIDKAVALVGGYAAADWSNSLPEAHATILDAEGDDRRGVYVDGSGVATITLSGLTIQRGAPKEADRDADGGGIYVLTGSVVIHDSRVLSNTTVNGGGGAGIYVAQGTAELGKTLVQGNMAAGGGGMHVQNGAVTIRDSRFQGNSAFWDGGVSVDGGHVLIRNSTFQGNSGANECGAICVVGGATVTVTENLIVANWTENTAASGGGIHVNDPSAVVYIAHNTVMSNTTSFDGGSGGGLNVEGGQVSVIDNTFQGNAAAGGGGANVSALDVTLVGNRFLSNSAFFGGGLQVGGGNLTMRGNVFLGNNAGPDQGSTVNIETGSVDAANDIIAQSNNPVAEAVYVGSGILEARHWTMADNGSYALKAVGGSATLTNTIVAGHSVAGLWGAGVTAQNTLFYDNGATCGGGAVCTGNLAGDPGFVDPLASDYHITVSAAMDAGVDAGITNDIDGDARPYNLGPDLGADELIAVTISAEAGNTLAYTDTQGAATTLQIPVGAVTQEVTLVYQPLPYVSPPSGLLYGGWAFDLTGYRGEGPLAAVPLQTPVTITLGYTEGDVAGMDESSLFLATWDEMGMAWEDAACGPYTRDQAGNRIVVPVCHLSRFALLGQGYRVYLPVVIRAADPF